MYNVTAFVPNPTSLVQYDKCFLQAVPRTLLFDTTASNPEQVARQLREYYFDDQPITMDLFQNLTDVSSRILFYIQNIFCEGVWV